MKKIAQMKARMAFCRLFAGYQCPHAASRQRESIQAKRKKKHGLQCIQPELIPKPTNTIKMTGFVRSLSPAIAGLFAGIPRT